MVSTSWTGWACIIIIIIIIIIMMIIIIIITFKGAIRDFLQSPHSAANCVQHVRSSGPGRKRVQITCYTSSAYHVQHDVLRATWYEGTARQTLNRIYLSFILLAEPLTNEGGEETGVPGENPWQRASENATYYSPKIQAPSETRTRAIALVVG